MNLTGKRTYLTAGAMVVYAILGYSLGEMNVNMAVQMALNGLALIFLRKAVS